MALELGPVEARVLGCLIEKDLTTPEYYPLSLNALTNACNQKSNREPVVNWDDATVRAGLDELREKGLCVFVHEAGSRVEKYRHRLQEKFNFTRGEQALVGVLLLRGAQTAAELRERTQRMYAFEDVETAEHALQKLADWEPEALAVLMPRQPGRKEPRWMHLLSGPPDLSAPAVDEPVRVDRLGDLEAEIAGLRAEVEALRAEFEKFRSQF